MHLEFEKPLVELESKIEELDRRAKAGDERADAEAETLRARLDEMRREIFSKLDRWNRVQVARHPKRPYTLDYIGRLATDFIELHGDRSFRDDPAVVGGLATFSGRRTVVVGQQKGRDTKENIRRNFGMMHPEGYRKALRLFKLADKFRLPIVVFIDTPGAYPGIGAEERGQAEAIARNIFEMGRISVPIIIAIIGEGASGGALGIGVGNTILMMENAWYSVISPEGCAAILWRDRAEAPRAAEALKLTARDLLELGMIDRIVPEPPGGAHADPVKAIDALGEEIIAELDRFAEFDSEKIIEHRLAKYRAMGVYQEG
ncbi:MAG TPA: acetyl-CoA carboxylase carboxyltransferase subunit alpha [candidate division Zixibacteria bacterium]|nr:acetyl-CoA carboxylase carboxyltransferase subunit alpha [candidate division Zixibacteria bacterium]